jgi:VWFA-related protein
MRSTVASRAPGALLLASAIAAPAFLLAQAPQPSQPSFRSDIEHVQVDVRVVDADNEPVAGLTQDLFQVLEDGVLQDIDSFAAIDLPRTPIRQDAVEVPSVRADAASNINESADSPIGIAYLVIVDDQSIFKARTSTVRGLLKNFVLRHLGPNDRAAFVSTGYSRVFQDFTADKNRLLAAAARVFGDSAGSPTVQALTDITNRANAMDGPSGSGGNRPTPPRSGPPAAALDKAIGPARSTQAMLAAAVAAMGTVGARSRAILFVTESNPVPMVTELAGFTFVNQSTGSDQPLRSGVPIYPIDPRGLTSLGDELVDVGAIPLEDAPGQTLLNEIAQSRERMHALALDTGGFVIANNNVDEGLDRIARLSGTYYSVGYYAKNARRDGKYHRIEVKVNHPGVRVLARRGYLSPRGTAGVSANAGPSLRDTLDATFPATAIPLSVSAAPFRSGRDTSVAVVVEGAGVAGPGIELAVVALDDHGSAKGRAERKFEWSPASAAGVRVREQGFRWLPRLTLKPGRYQLRVAGAATRGPERGSVRLDIDIPDLSDGDLNMSGIVLASVQQFQTATFKPDPLLADDLPGPPTAVRSFAPGDEVTTFAEVYDNAKASPQGVEMVFSVVSTANGRPLFSHVEPAAATADRMVRFRTNWTVPTISGAYVLTVGARRPGATSPSVTRQIPFEISAGR